MHCGDVKMDKLGSFERDETYTILTWPNLAYSRLGLRHENTYIQVEFDVWHFPRFASKRG